jgi:hypothetical protein
MRLSHTILTTSAALITAVSAATPAGGPGRISAENARPLVRPGEELEYTVQSAHFGKMGKAAMRVEKGIIDGVAAYQLSFDFTARVALFKISDRTRSWVRADSLCTLRYSKHEHSPISSRNEDVVVDHSLEQWADGKTRAPLASEHPLDELSMIYLLRSLDLQPNEQLELHRHFDARRNPIRVEALARQTVSGRNVVVYDMKVPDTRQKNGFSTIRFFISDDAERVPVRIETSMPVAGRIVMTLTSAQVLPALAAK